MSSTCAIDTKMAIDYKIASDSKIAFDYKIAFDSKMATDTITRLIDSLGQINLDRFTNWIMIYHIQIKDNNQFDKMFSNWLDNDKYIEYINSLNKTYKLGHNKYSGMNQDEFRELAGFKTNIESFKYNLLGLQKNLNFSTNITYSTSPPTFVDWRTKNVVTPVKDQGQCGSCWSFSNTGALEGAYALKYDKLLSFSEQELVDCSNLKNGGPNMGCNGGQISQTMDWIGKNGGLCTESDYPYFSGTTQSGGACNSKLCEAVVGSTVISHTDVDPNSDDAMMDALVKQPVSVGIEADQRAFQLYSSGVFTDSCGTSIDHAVLLVGYGHDNATDLDYYILKNSWGVTWGDQGYIYIGKGTDKSGKVYNSGKGQCGVLMMGAYPNL